MSSSISTNLWILVPDKFSGVRKPDNDTEVLDLISACNVRGIISLLDDKENLELYRRLNIEYIHLPIAGGTTPTIEQLNLAFDFQKSLGGLVAVHCSNGRRRTGTLLGGIYCKLLQSGAIKHQLSDNSNNDNNKNNIDYFEETKLQLLQAKPDCELRDTQWEWIKSLT